MRPNQPLERLLETALWRSRMVMIIPVVLGVLLAFGAFYVAAVDGVYLLGVLSRYAEAATTPVMRGALRTEAISSIVKIVDVFLIGGILLVFSFGLYELFINRLDAAEGAENADRILHIRSLDDLKDRLAKLVVLVLIIEFFQFALGLHYSTAQDLLGLAGGIVLVALAAYLTSHKPGPAAPAPEPPPARPAALPSESAPAPQAAPSPHQGVEGNSGE